jgi:hypothetical protein
MDIKLYMKSYTYSAVVIERGLPTVNFGQTGKVTVYRLGGKQNILIFTPSGTRNQFKINENSVFNTDDQFDPEKMQEALNKIEHIRWMQINT